MFFSIVDEHGEQQLINALHVMRVSNNNGAKRACLHMVGGAWVKTQMNVRELSDVIDSVFIRGAQYMRFLAALDEEQKAVEAMHIAMDAPLLPFPTDKTDEYDERVDQSPMFAAPFCTVCQQHHGLPESGECRGVKIVLTANREVFYHPVDAAPGCICTGQGTEHGSCPVHDKAKWTGKVQ